MTHTNQLQLEGRLGKDPIIRYTASGMAVVSFDIAVNKSVKNKNGEWDQKTSWVKIAAFGDKAERINQEFKKGSWIFITNGELATSTYIDKGGNERNTLEVVANKFIGIPDSNKTLPASSKEIIYANTESFDDDIPF